MFLHRTSGVRDTVVMVSSFFSAHSVATLSFSLSVSSDYYPLAAVESPKFGSRKKNGIEKMRKNNNLILKLGISARNRNLIGYTFR